MIMEKEFIIHNQRVDELRRNERDKALQDSWKTHKARLDAKEVNKRI